MGGPGGRDRTLAVKIRKNGRKIRKNGRKIIFFVYKLNLPPKNIFFCIYLLVMPKYWVKNYFAHGRFPDVGSRKTAEKNTFFS